MKAIFPIIASIGAITLSLSSCTKDDIETFETENDAKTPLVSVGTDNSAFTFKGAHNETLTMSVSGTDVAISRNQSQTKTINGKLEFANNYSGYLLIQDGTFSSKKIPFQKSSDVIRLDFKDTQDFDGNTILLTQAKASSKKLMASKDPVKDAISSTKAENCLKNITKALTKQGLDMIFKGLGSSVAGPILDMVMPTTATNNYSEEFSKIENQLATIDSHIDLLGMKMHKRDLTEDYKNHWYMIRTMDTNNSQTKDLLRSNPNDSVAILDSFSKTVINNYTLSAYIETIMDGYFTSFGGTNIFQDLDEYLVTSYPFLSQSTAERYLYRAEDLKVISETAQLMYRHWLVKNAHVSAESLKKKTVAFMETFTEKQRFNTYHKRIVCTLPDAYCEMDTMAYTKKFGEAEFASGRFNPYDFKIYRDEILAQEWGKYYIYSMDNVGARKTELSDQCLTSKEAQAIYNSFSGRSLYDILTDEGGMKGLDDRNTVMLIGGWSYIDVYRGWDYFDWRMMTRVWDNKNNMYDGNYVVDCLRRTGKGLSFISHTNDSRAYCTKVLNHFHNSMGEKDYDAFMQFVWKDPGEDPRENPSN